MRRKSRLLTLAFQFREDQEVTHRPFQSESLALAFLQM